MKCDYNPKFLHFVIAVDVGTVMFFTSICVFASLIMDDSNTGDFQMQIVKNLFHSFTTIKICSLTVICLGLLASILVLCYDLVLLISAKSLRKIQRKIREELVNDGEE